MSYSDSALSRRAALSLTALAGARIDTSDPLAVLHHGKQARPAVNRADVTSGLADGAVLKAPMQGTIVSIDVHAGDVVRRGQQVMVMESMKMEHVISAPHAGTVTELDVTVGSTVAMDQVLAVIAPQEQELGQEQEEATS